MSTTDDPRGRGPAVPPADELDELASALVDGEATAEEASRATEAAVVQRMAAFGRVAGVVGAPVTPVDDATRDRAIATAIAAWGTEATAEPARADELGAHRRRRTARLWPLGVAAAVLAAVALGGVALRDGGDDDDQLAGESTSADDSAAAGSAPSEADRDTTLGAAIPPFELGTFSTVDDLVAFASSFALAEATVAAEDDADAGLSVEEGTSSPSDGAGSGAGQAAGVCAAPAGTVSSGHAVLVDRSVDVYVVDDGAGRRVVVYDEADCSVVFDGPAPG